VTRPWSLLFDDEQEDVHVAVVPGFAQVLAVARGLALAPVLLATAAPEPGASGFECAFERLAVQPREHQDLAGSGLLHDRGNETGGAERGGGDLVLRVGNRGQRR